MPHTPYTIPNIPYPVPYFLNTYPTLVLVLRPEALKPSLRSSPVTPPRFRPLGQPETRFADEKVVTQ